MCEKIDWKYGCIVEVAAYYHNKYRIDNITFQVGRDFVIFLTNGYFFTSHIYKKGGEE